MSLYAASSIRASTRSITPPTWGSCVLDEVATAIATGAAGNIIAYMLNGRVDALRLQVSRIFRHGTEQERSAVNAMDLSALSVHHGFPGGA